MDRKVVTEIVEFEIAEHVSKDSFVDIVSSVENNFHMKQRGYIDSELVKGKDNSWTMIMHWESIDDARQAVKLMMQETSTEEFRQVVDPKTVRMSLLEQIKTWSK